MNDKRHSSDLIFVLMIFAVFLVSALLLITAGTGEYRKITARSLENDDLRIASAYLTQKVRQGKRADGIRTGSIDGIDALLLRQEIAGRTYVTYLYVCEGELRELMTEEGNTDVVAISGTPILPMRDLSFSSAGENALRIEFTCGDGSEKTLILSVLDTEGLSAGVETKER